MPKIKYKSFIIIFFLVFLVQAKVYAFQIIDNQTVDANKTWTLKFTGNLGFDDLTKSGIVVTDSKGNFVNVTINQGNDPKTILVNAPQEGYISGEKYTLTINTKAHSSKGQHLRQVITMHFNIKSNDNKIVTFEDANLEKAVRDTINKPTGDIYKSDVERITEIDAIVKGIHSISGIENLTNLQQISLDGNEISDISSLKDLHHLTYISLVYNNISDINPLKDLTNLKALYIENNQVSDISALKGLTNLQHVGLSHNNICDISSLKGLTNLQRIFLDSNQISDISSLKGLTNLQHLRLDGNQISEADKELVKNALPNCNID